MAPNVAHSNAYSPLEDKERRGGERERGREAGEKGGWEREG